MTKPTILVIGATGQQGGSVIDYLLKGHHYQVAALTRDPTKDKAKALEAQGVKLFKGDLSQPETLKEAFKGIHGLFLVTQFWEKFSIDLELQDGKNAIDAAIEAGVKHVVFSTLEDVEKELGYKVPHFDGKGRISAYAKSKNVPLTEVFVSYYTNNILGFFPPKKNEEGTYVFAWPTDKDAKVDFVDVTQLGGVVSAIFQHPHDWIGKHLGVSEGSYTGTEVAEIFTKVTGKKAIFVGIPYEDAKKTFGEDLSNMFRYYKDKEGKLRDPKTSRHLYPKLCNFEEFLHVHEKWWKAL